IGAVLRPAEASVIVLAAHVEPELAEALAGAAQQVADALDGVHLEPERGQDRGLVSRPGADFQHPLRAGLQQQLGHARDHPWLGDRLAMADRQGDRKSTRLNSSHVKISYAV